MKRKKGVRKSGVRKSVLIVLGIIVIAAVVLAVWLIAGKSGGKSGKATVEMYVMSKCPYGVQAEDAIAPALKTFGSSIEFKLNFIGGIDSSGNFSSLHGDSEIKGDTVQLCAAKYEPSKYMDFIVCMNKDAANIPTNWEKCADDLKLNKASIKTCYESAEGRQLLASSFTASESAGAQGSPTIKINGKDYAGQRDSASFTRAICQYSSNPACSSIPLCTKDSDCASQEGKIPKCINPGVKDAKCEYAEDAKTTLTVVNDITCSSCDSLQITGALQQMFLNMDVKTVDINSAEGKKLVSDYKIDVIPSFIFDKSVENTYLWKNNAQVQTIFESVNGNYKILDKATGASHYVNPEKRNEILLQAGINLSDTTPQIDFYVMAFCPYGNTAEEEVAKVYAKLGSSAEFRPHYVVSNDGSSLHGVQEANQDVREICVNKYFGVGKWFDFTIAINGNCTAQNADACWENVANSLELDPVKIKDCQQNEATALLAREAQLDNLLAVDSSPTIFVNGDKTASDANSMLSALCDKFAGAKPAGCSGTIAETQAASSAPASGGCGA